MKFCQTAGWHAPADHPDLVAHQEALMVKEGLHEVGRRLADGYDDRFVERLRNSESLAGQLEQALRTGDVERAARPLQALDQACTRCHVEYRN